MVLLIISIIITCDDKMSKMPVKCPECSFNKREKIPVEFRLNSTHCFKLLKKNDDPSTYYGTEYLDTLKVVIPYYNDSLCGEFLVDQPFVIGYNHSFDRSSHYPIKIVLNPHENKPEKNHIGVCKCIKHFKTDDFKFVINSDQEIFRCFVKVNKSQSAHEIMIIPNSKFGNYKFQLMDFCNKKPLELKLQGEISGFLGDKMPKSYTITVDGN